MRSKKLVSALAAGCFLALLVTALATGASKSRTAAAPVGSGKASATKSVCGHGTGKKATGTPIKIGGIDMLIPGVDFTTIGKVAKAYFKCVNDNGGINGRPIQLHALRRAAQPGAAGRPRAEARRERQGRRHRRQHELHRVRRELEVLQVQGLHRDRRGRPGGVLRHARSSSSRTWARATANIGAAQALVRAGAKSLVVASPDTIAAYADGGVLKVAEKAGIPGKSFPVQLPVTDANTIIQQLYQAAGQGGGIILDFTPDTAPALMKAAIAQGIVDKVKWGSSTPIANTFMAEQFPEFDGKMFINQEFNLLDASQGPDTRLMLAILKKYTKIAPQAFAQMGFMDGMFATKALLNVKGAITVKSYNAAVRALKNVKTDMLCKPWYVGNALPYHIPSNWDITVDYKAGKVVLKEKCFAIQAVDAELAQTRVWEKKYNLNTGG